MAADTPPAVQLAPDPDLQRPHVTYQTCLKLAREHPDKGIELAGKWITLGGGEPAKHCQALSLIGLKDYGEGARRLEELATASKQEPKVRANMLAQAAQGWLLQGENGRAYAAQTAALKLLPPNSKESVELYLDRAGTLADSGKYNEVMDDIKEVLRIDPNNAEAYAYRASIHRLQNELDDALDDAEAAVAADPNNLSGLLERGNLYRIKKRLAEARSDWLRILMIAPESATADAARINIEHLDVDAGAR